MPCLYWKIENKGELVLTYQFKNSTNNLFFYGIFGEEKGHCLFERPSVKCTTVHEDARMRVDLETKTVSYSEFFIEEKQINGVWSCLQNGINTTTNVSTSKGLFSCTPRTCPL